MKLAVHCANLSYAGGARPWLRPSPATARGGRGGRVDDVHADGPLVPDGGARPPAQEPMLEGYTSLGFLAGRTERMQLGLLVTGVTYRHPGLLAKIGHDARRALRRPRACSGSALPGTSASTAALGVPYPPVAERFERLEETIQICRQMWSDNDGPTRASTTSSPRRSARRAGPAAPAADPDRRRRRAQDAAPGRPVRRRLQPVRPRTRRVATSSRCSTGTARTSAATRATYAAP